MTPLFSPWKPNLTPQPTPRQRTAVEHLFEDCRQPEPYSLETGRCQGAGRPRAGNGLNEPLQTTPRCVSGVAWALSRPLGPWPIRASYSTREMCFDPVLSFLRMLSI